MKLIKTGVQIGFGLVIGKWLGNNVIYIVNKGILDPLTNRIVDTCKAAGVNVPRLIVKQRKLRNQFGFMRG